jgi:hypothetical protein
LPLAARPFASTSAKVITPARFAAASNAITCFKPGSPPFTSSTLATCSAVEQHTATASESRRMYSVCFAVRVG